MDHYILILFKENAACEEKDALVKFIKSLHPSKDYCMPLVSHIDPLLHRNALFMASMGNSNASPEQDTHWSKVDDDNVDEYVSKVFQYEIAETKSNFTTLVDTKLLSETLHFLADQLPITGTYILDVVISCKFLIGMNVSDHMDFASSLHRLCKWHNALMSVIMETQSDEVDLLDWKNVIEPQMINKENIFSQTAIWRGGLQVGSSNNQNSVYLPGFHLSLDASKISNNLSFMKENAIFELPHPENKDTIIVSSKMDVLDECDILTVPPYMISPFVFQLCFKYSHNNYGEAHEFMDLLKQDARRCFILRLQYSKISQPYPKNNYTAEKWKHAVLSGNINTTMMELPYPKQYFTFIVTKHFSNSALATAYLLHHSSRMNIQFYNELLKFQLPISNGISKNTKEKIAMSFNSIPHLRCNIAKCINVLEDVQMDVLSSWIDHDKGNPPAKKNITTREIFSRVSDVVFSKLVVNIVHTKPLLNMPVCSLEEEVPLDSTDWPERIYLLQQQILSDKTKKCHSENLAGLAPPMPQKNTISVTAEDITNYFKPSGEAKIPTSESTKILPLIQNSNDSLLSSPDEVIQTEWPAILQYEYQDLYYNYSNFCEEKETRGSKIRDLYVAHETASTCNNQQSSPRFNLLHIQDKDKKKSNCVNTQNAKKATKRKAISPDEGISLSEVRKRRRSIFSESIDVFHAPELRNNHTDVERESQGFDDHAPSVSGKVTLRRSPRKPLRVDYRSSSYRRPVASGSSTVTKVSDDISEKHKMKLRAAVAAALEPYGITLNHPDFKPCGRKLFAVCKAFAKDVFGKGNTSAQLKKIAQAHVKQVVEFEMQKQS